MGTSHLTISDEFRCILVEKEWSVAWILPQQVFHTICKVIQLLSICRKKNLLRKSHLGNEGFKWSHLSSLIECRCTVFPKHPVDRKHGRVKGMLGFKVKLLGWRPLQGFKDTNSHSAFPRRGCSSPQFWSSFDHEDLHRILGGYHSLEYTLQKLGSRITNKYK